MQLKRDLLFKKKKKMGPIEVLVGLHVTWKTEILELQNDSILNTCFTHCSTTQTVNIKRAVPVSLLNKVNSRDPSSICFLSPCFTLMLRPCWKNIKRSHFCDAALTFFSTLSSVSGRLMSKQMSTASESG